MTQNNVPEIATIAAPTSEFPTGFVRDNFPAISRAAPFAYVDNGAGSQAPKLVLDRVARRLLDFNMARGGRYGKAAKSTGSSPMRAAPSPCC